MVSEASSCPVLAWVHLEVDRSYSELPAASGAGGHGCLFVPLLLRSGGRPGVGWGLGLILGLLASCLIRGYYSSCGQEGDLVEAYQGRVAVRAGLCFLRGAPGVLACTGAGERS